MSARPTVDDYELLDVLGGGGMATVWRARRRGSAGREVALKVLHAHLRRDERAVERFLREARIGARVRHAHVVPVLEVVRSNDTLALAVELVDGGSIASLSRAMRPPPRVVFRLLDDLLRGLTALHALEEDGVPLRVVHRDVSPENVLVGRDGVARLSDFGIARASLDTKLTATGSVYGKLPYVAPEQARGDAVDARADVWAAGVVAYELVTGHTFLSETLDVTAALRRLIEGQYPRIEASAPAAIAEAIDRALELDATARWPDADAFRRRLQAAAELEDEGLADAVEVAAWVEAAIAEAARPLDAAAGPEDLAASLRVADHVQASNESASILPATSSDSAIERSRPRRWSRRALGVGGAVALGLSALAIVWLHESPTTGSRGVPLVHAAPTPVAAPSPVATVRLDDEPAPSAGRTLEGGVPLATQAAQVATPVATSVATPERPRDGVQRRVFPRRRAPSAPSTTPPDERSPASSATPEPPRSPLARNPYERR